MFDKLPAKSPAKALSHQRPSRIGATVGGCAGMLFFSLFFLVGALTTLVLFIGPLLGFFKILTWQEVPCVITEIQREDRGQDVSLNLRYEYEYAGQTYVSTRLRHSGHGSGRTVAKISRWTEMEPGTLTVCYVNPENPEQAILLRDFPYEILFGLIPLVFVLVGLTGFLFSLRSFVKPLKEPAERQPYQSVSQILAADIQKPLTSIEVFSQPKLTIQGNWQQTVHVEQVWMPTYTEGPCEIKSDHKPLMSFIGTLVFSIIWNTIFILFVMGLISDGLSVFMTLFMIPFALVGGLVSVLAVREFLILYNPVPQIYVSNAAVDTGDSIRLKWVLTGRLSNVNQLKLTLFGQESATYQRGTSTYTDKNRFYQQELTVTSDPYEIESGETAVNIPADTMHTFLAARNKVQWFIELQGVIPYWPDVKQTFELVVRPAVTTTGRM